MKDIKKDFKDAKDWVTSRGDSLVTYFKNLPGRMNRAVDGIWNGLKNSFKSAMNWIIGRWNDLSFSLPSVNFLGNTIGGGTINTPNINYFAQGGVGGGLAMVGEQGRELVRLPYGSTVIPNNTTEQMMGGMGSGSGETRINITIDSGGSNTDAFLLELIRRAIRTSGGANNVQAALGN